jgi:Zn-dependent peptidase ImmA (M78 family)/DNA-binding XRE family transcriptional regulator
MARIRKWTIRIMAPRVKAFINPALIAWARETAGFTLLEAADRLGIEEDRLAAWENAEGEDLPSIPQLRKIAALFKRPLAVFYLAERPHGFAVMRDFRRHPSAALVQSPSLQLEIRAANERRELALDLASDLNQDVPTFTLRASEHEDSETVGSHIRDALGVTMQLQSSWRDVDGRAGFNAWRSRVEQIGVLVFQTTRFTSAEASGFAIAGDTLPVIAVNRQDALTRRTFSLLHELVHLMLHVSGVSDLQTSLEQQTEDQQIEIFCNQVAAAALIPKDALLSDSRVVAHGRFATDWSDEELSELARQFNVSRETLVRRLLTFERTTTDFYRAKRDQYNDEYEAARKRKKEIAFGSEMKRNMPQETISNLGRPLVRMLLTNYYQDRITLSEISGYLGLKVKHIPKLEQVAGLR